jgi:tRNA A37 threonylcarbamoyladenosine synthetase subunit TsaC/SUA5/YrdC
MDWKSLVLMIATVALSANPKTRGLGPLVGPAITATEAMIKGKPGESKAEKNKRKLDNAVALVKTGISAGNELHAGTVGDIDPNISDKMLASIVSTVVDSANLIQRNTALAIPA